MTSRLQGPLTPRVQRFRLGSFEVTSLLDGAIVRAPLRDRFAANAPPEAVAALAAGARLDPVRFQHQFVATLVDTGRQLILFDTGCGELRRGVGIGDFSQQLPDGELMQLIGLAGYRAEDIDMVVLTHGHPDHVGGLLRGGLPAFPGARLVLGAAEHAFWTRGEVREARRVHRQLYMAFAAPLAAQAQLIEAGEELVPGITALDASGHSPGMLAFHIESEGQRLLLWADTAIHYVVSLAHPEWHADVDDDKPAAARTRARLLDMAATERLWVAGAHMPFPSVGLVERRDGGGYRWVPVGYQLNL
jgi:glyoxylase-like metal-dependent hydrolase (beta-lactamase superfamily II)